MMGLKSEPKKSWYARKWDGEKLILYQYDEKPSEAGPYTVVRKPLHNGIALMYFAVSGIYMGSTIITKT